MIPLARTLLCVGEVAINPQSSRMRQLVWPREHGAWGILYIPLITGAAIGLMQTPHFWPLLNFSVAATAVFCLRTPFESLLGNTPMRARSDVERRTVAGYLVLFSAVALLALIALLRDGRNPALLLIGAIAAVFFTVQAVLGRSGRRRTITQLIGALGLTSTSAGAYYVVTGHLDGRALALWVANWMFAANQVHYVHTRIHGAKLSTSREKLAVGWTFLSGQAAFLVVLAAAFYMGLLPRLTLLAFLPVLIRGTAWFFRKTTPLRIHRLGISELAQAVAFGMLLVCAFMLE